MAGQNSPNWADYANLTANIIQVGQLVAVNRQLHDLQRIEAAREERKFLLNKLRQIIFDTEDDLKRISLYTNRAPMGVFTVTMLFVKLFDELEITPQTFEEFVDKDRVKSIRMQIADIRTNATHELTKEEQREVETKVEQVFRIEDLDVLIKAQQSKEELVNTDDLMDKLSKEYEENVKPWTNRSILSAAGITVGTMVSMCICLPLASSASDALGSSNGGVYLGLLAGFFAILIFFTPIATFIHFLVKRSQSIPKGYSSLKAKRAALLRNLLPIERYEDICLVFGKNRSSKEYMKIREELVEFFHRITSYDMDGQPLPENALQVNFG